MKTTISLTESEYLRIKEALLTQLADPQSDSIRTELNQIVNRLDAAFDDVLVVTHHRGYQPGLIDAAEIISWQDFDDDPYLATDEYGNPLD